MSNTDARRRRHISILFFLCSVLIAPTIVPAMGQREDELTSIDQLIDAKRYNDAILAINKILAEHPERFEDALRRLERIIDFRDEYTIIAQESLQAMLDDPTNYERKLEIIRRLRSLDASPNRAMEDFLQRTEENALFANNRGLLFQIMDEAFKLWQSGEIVAAINRYRDGFSLYRDSFTTGKFGASLVETINQHLSELSNGLDRFAELQPRLAIINSEIGNRLTAIWRPEDAAALSALVQESSAILLEIAAIRNTALRAGFAMEREFNILRAANPAVGDNLFLPFAFRLILGRKTKSASEGLQAVIGTVWTTSLTGLQSLTDQAAASAYRQAVAGLANPPEAAAAAFGVAGDAAMQALEVIGLWSAVLTSDSLLKPSVAVKTLFADLLPAALRYQLLARAMRYGVRLQTIDMDFKDAVRRTDGIIAAYDLETAGLGSVLQALAEAGGAFNELAGRFATVGDEIDSYAESLRLLDGAELLGPNGREPLDLVKTQATGFFREAIFAEFGSRVAGLTLRIKELDLRISRFLPTLTDSAISASLADYESGTPADTIAERLVAIGLSYQTAADRAAAMSDEVDGFQETLRSYRAEGYDATALEALLSRRSDEIRAFFRTALGYEKLTGLAAFQVRLGELAKRVDRFKLSVTPDAIAAMETAYDQSRESADAAIAALQNLERSYRGLSGEAGALIAEIDTYRQELKNFAIDQTKEAASALRIDGLRGQTVAARQASEDYSVLSKLAVFRIELGEWSKRIGSLRASVSSTVAGAIEKDYDSGALAAATAVELLARYGATTRQSAAAATVLVSEAGGFRGQLAAFKIADSDRKRLADRIGQIQDAAIAVRQAAEAYGLLANLATFRIGLGEWSKRISDLKGSLSSAAIEDIETSYSSGVLAAETAVARLADYSSALRLDAGAASIMENEVGDFRGRLATFVIADSDRTALSARIGQIVALAAGTRRTAEEYSVQALLATLRIDVGEWAKRIGNLQASLSSTAAADIESDYEGAGLAAEAAVARLADYSVSVSRAAAAAVILENEAAGYRGRLAAFKIADSDRTPLAARIDRIYEVAAATVKAAEDYGVLAMLATFRIHLGEWSKRIDKLKRTLSATAAAEIETAYANDTIAAEAAAAGLADYRSFVRKAVVAAAILENEVGGFRDQLAAFQIADRDRTPLADSIDQIHAAAIAVREAAAAYDVQAMLAEFRIRLGEWSKRIGTLQATLSSTVAAEIETTYDSGAAAAAAAIANLTSYGSTVRIAAAAAKVLENEASGFRAELAAFLIADPDRRALSDHIGLIQDTAAAIRQAAEGYEIGAMLAAFRISLGEWSKRIETLKSSLSSTVAAEIEKAYGDDAVAADTAITRLADYGSSVQRAADAAAVLKQEVGGFRGQLSAFGISDADRTALAGRIDKIYAVADITGQAANNYGIKAILAAFRIRLGEWLKRIASLRSSLSLTAIAKIEAGYDSDALAADAAVARLAELNSIIGQTAADALGLENEADGFHRDLAVLKIAEVDRTALAGRIDEIDGIAAAARKFALDCGVSALLAIYRIHLGEWSLRIERLRDSLSSTAVAEIATVYNDGASTAETAIERLAGYGDIVHQAAVDAIRLADEFGGFRGQLAAFAIADADRTALAGRIDSIHKVAVATRETADAYGLLARLAVFRIYLGEWSKRIGELSDSISSTAAMEIETAYIDGALSAEAAVERLASYGSSALQTAAAAELLEVEGDGFRGRLAVFEIASADRTALAGRIDQIFSNAVATRVAAEQYGIQAMLATFRIRLSEWSKRIENLKGSLFLTVAAETETAYDNGVLSAEIAVRRLADYGSSVQRVAAAAATLESQVDGYRNELAAFQIEDNDRTALSDRIERIYMTAVDARQTGGNYNELARLAVFRINLSEWSKRVEKSKRSISATTADEIEMAYDRGHLAAEAAVLLLADYGSAVSQAAAAAAVLASEVEGFRAELTSLQLADADRRAAADRISQIHDVAAVSRSAAEDYGVLALLAAFRIHLGEWSKRIQSLRETVSLTTAAEIQTAYDNGALAAEIAIARLADYGSFVHQTAADAVLLENEVGGFRGQLKSYSISDADRTMLADRIEKIRSSAALISKDSDGYGQTAKVVSFRIRLAELSARIKEFDAELSDAAITKIKTAHAAGRMATGQAIAALQSLVQEYASHAERVVVLSIKSDEFKMEYQELAVDASTAAELETRMAKSRTWLNALASAAAEYRLLSIELIYHLPLADATVRIDRLEADYRSARVFLDGDPIVDGGFGPKDPKGSIEGLTAVILAVTDEAVILDAWRNSLTTVDAAFAADSRFAILKALEASLRTRILKVGSDARSALADAKDRITRSEAAIAEGDKLYLQAVDAMGLENFAMARERLQRSGERYDFSLALQTSASLQAERDKKLLGLAAAISKAENSVVVRDVRQLITSARDYYFTAEYGLAESALLTAQDRWRTTNVDDDSEVSYWLALVRAALSLQTGREIAVTAPLFSEMSQLLSSAYSLFDEGKTLLSAKRRDEALTVLEIAKQKIREVKILFPLNREAGLLQLRIDQLTDPNSFTAGFRKRVSEAQANLALKPQEAYAELMDLAEINPKYPGLKTIIDETQVLLGLRLPPPDPAKLKRSTELTTEAKRIVDAGNREQYPAALGKLVEALKLNPDNAAAIALKDRIQTTAGGEALAVLTAAAEQEYQRAVRELQKGNTILALAIVEKLLLDSQSRNSPRVLELERRIKARL